MSDNSAAIEEMTNPIQVKVWELAGNQGMCIDLGMGRVEWHKPCHSHCLTKVVLHSDYKSLQQRIEDYKDACTSKQHIIDADKEVINELKAELAECRERVGELAAGIDQLLIADMDRGTFSYHARRLIDKALKEKP